jgi:hypothetical protein
MTFVVVDLDQRRQNFPQRLLFGRQFPFGEILLFEPRHHAVELPVGLNRLVIGHPFQQSHAHFIQPIKPSN